MRSGTMEVAEMAKTPKRIKLSVTKGVFVAVSLALVLGYILLEDPLASSSLLGGAQEIFASTSSLQEFVEGFGSWSLLVFLGIQATQVVAGPVPAGPVIVAGSALFGCWEGLALSMAGIMAGSVLAFLLGRRFGLPLLRRLVGEELVAKHRPAPGNSDGWWLLMVLLMPIPAGGDAACALAGLSSISLRRFILMVSVGRLPGTALAAFVGAGLMRGHLVAPIAAGITALVVVGVTFRYRRSLVTRLVPVARKAARSLHPHRLLPQTCQAPAVEPLITEETELSGDCVEQLGQEFYHSVDLEPSWRRKEVRWRGNRLGRHVVGHLGTKGRTKGQQL
jgi:uncharacterized membrane protein YdjX (TVP38/TMEM64 family)